MVAPASAAAPRRRSNARGVLIVPSPLNRCRVDHSSIRGAIVQQMAAERASNDDVKAFGQMMVKDHTQADQELMQIASRMSVRRRRHAVQQHLERARSIQQKVKQANRPAAVRLQTPVSRAGTVS